MNKVVATNCRIDKTLNDYLVQQCLRLSYICGKQITVRELLDYAVRNANFDRFNNAEEFINEVESNKR